MPVAHRRPGVHVHRAASGRPARLPSCSLPSEAACGITISHVISSSDSMLLAWQPFLIAIWRHALAPPMDVERDPAWMSAHYSPLLNTASDPSNRTHPRS